jgi:hypothetical protein
MVKTAEEASKELMEYRNLLMEDPSTSQLDTGALLAKAILLFTQIEQSKVNAFVIPDVSNCVKNCTDFKNIESLLFDFWVTIKNDVDCINSENIIGKINNFCKTLK